MAGGSPPQRFSVTPAGPPAVDLDSDIIQKWLHIPRGEGLRPRRSPPPTPSYASRTSRLSSGLQTDRLESKGSHKPLPGLD